MKWNKEEWAKVEFREALKLKSGKFLKERKPIGEEHVAVYGGNGINGSHNEVMFDKPTVVIGRVGAHCGNVHLTKGPSWITDNALFIKDFKKDFNLNFLARLLRSKALNQYSSQSGQPLISEGRLTKIKIPLPPLATQKEIAELLDAADALRQKTQAQLDALDQLAQSVFLEMFGDPVTNEKGWEVRKLGEMAIKITDGTHHSPPLKETGFKYVTAKHVKSDGVYFLDKPSYISEKDHKDIYARCAPAKGDVLYIKDGATTGVAAINPFDEEISLLSSLALIKPDPSFCNSHYIVAWLNSEKTKKYLRYTYMSGAAITRFTLKKINSFKMPVPPLPLQNQFAAIIENIEAQKASLKAILQESEDLFGCLLQEVFG